ncbi:uncharacterized protein LOC125028146 [Penaeus chinensis]|uniref:uncharacterized protein LOC125028146 n=1 Tax=Penaeus chinensis TaxID=139456 RepID=UPI001FB7269C|nr:uncharacterized protein LOC125028146 [Penaeus chinensis]
MAHTLGETDSSPVIDYIPKPPVVTVPYKYTERGVDPRRLCPPSASIQYAQVLYDAPKYHMDTRYERPIPAAPPTAPILYPPSPYQYQVRGVDPKITKPPSAPILYKKILY